MKTSVAMDNYEIIPLILIEKRNLCNFINVVRPAWAAAKFAAESD